MMKKKKRVLSLAQKKATKRNWHKGIISGMLKHCNNMKQSKSLSLVEQMQIIRCKTMIEKILIDWKSTI